MKSRAWLASATLLLLVGCAQSADDSDQAYTDRMAEEHKDDTPTPNPATESAGATEVETSSVVYAQLGDQEITGYLAKPSTAVEGAPAIIVIQEWWGLNDNIRAMAEKMAGEGYIALAVDLYEGKVASDPDGARELMMAGMEHSSRLEDNLRQAYAYLEQLGASKIGSIGWCFGGGWSLNTALMLPEQLDAAVIYYGRLNTDREQLAALQVPILGLFGGLDQGIPIAMVQEFESVLSELGKAAQIHVYEEADHAFANPSGTRYNAPAAEDAWLKTMTFLNEHLKS